MNAYKYCAEWRHRRCRTAGCHWFSESIEAATVTYEASLRELFGSVKAKTYTCRLDLLVLILRGLHWVDTEHKFNMRLMIKTLVTKRGFVRTFLLSKTYSPRQSAAHCST